VKELINQLVDFAESPSSNKALHNALKVAFVAVVFAAACSFLVAISRVLSEEDKDKE
jgi:ABC-type amino acid transport system permease subunit